MYSLEKMRWIVGVKGEIENNLIEPIEVRKVEVMSL